MLLRVPIVIPLDSCLSGFPGVLSLGSKSFRRTGFGACRQPALLGDSAPVRQASTLARMFLV